MPTVPVMNAPSVAPTTTAGARFSAPGLVNPTAPNGAGFEIRTPELRADTRQIWADAEKASAGVPGMDKLINLANKIQLDAIEQANQVRINEALNEAVQTRLALTYDPKEGYVHLQGKAAIERPDNKSLDMEYGQRYDDAIQGIAARLGNDRQRAIFMEKASTLSTQFKGGLMEHVAKEFTNHSLSVQSGTIATSIGQMGLSFGDPEALSQSIAAIKGATAEEGRLRGWSAQQIEAATVKNLSAGHATVVKSALDAGMNEYAEEYFKIHKAEFSNEARMTVQAAVNEGVLEVKVQNAADSLIEKYGSDSAGAMEEIRQKYEGKERKEIENRFLLEARRQREFQKERQDEAMQNAWGKIQAGQRLTPFELSQMHPKDRAELQRYQRSLAEDGRRKTDVRAWLEFADTPVRELANMTAGDLLRKYGNSLSDADLRAAQGKIVSAREAVEKGDGAGLQVFTVQDAVKTAARDMGIIPKTGTKMTESQQESFDAFRLKLQDRVTLWESQNGKKANQEVIQDLVAQEKLNVVRVRGFLTDDTKPVMMLDDKEMGKAYTTVRAADGKGIEKVPLSSIPATYRADAIRRRKARGLPITEGAIAQMWVADGKPRD